MKNHSFWIALFITCSICAWARSAEKVAYLPGSPEELRKSLSLSPEDWKKLQSGGIVTHLHPIGYPQIGGTGFALLSEPSWKVWQVITDYPQYPHFYPRNRVSTILSYHPPQLVLKTELTTTPPFQAVVNESLLRHETSNPDLLLMTWESQKSSLQENFGFWLLEAKMQQTLVIYQINFQLKYLNREFVRPFAGHTLVSVLTAIRKQIREPRYEVKSGKIDFVWDPEKWVPGYHEQQEGSR